MLAARRAPVVRQLNERAKLRFFLSPAGYGAHWGEFSTFEEARAWLPETPEFDLNAHQDHYEQERTQRVYAFDYPVMFWLRQALEQGARTIYDIGGSVGVHYYAFEKYIGWPADLHWLVGELPPVSQRGRELARRRGADRLDFVDVLAPESIDRDIWMIAGVLEFLEGLSLEGMLASAKRQPSHLLLNKLPLHDGPDFVSTQNIGNGCFTPHRVYNRDAFIERLRALGYQVVDIWETPERSYFVPGRPDRSFDAYSGLYLRRY